MPFPSPRDLPNSGIEPRSPALQADSLPAEPPGKLRQHFYISLKRLHIEKDNVYSAYDIFSGGTGS